MKDSWTWEETIKFVQDNDEYKFLVEKAYFERDLKLNVERFRNSEEFIECLKLIRMYAPCAKSILDIGSGNGISAISFALEGYQVVCFEPDKSEIIGSGAIRKLKIAYNLDNIEIYEGFAEQLEFKDELFDVAYSRQCMHHAYDLEMFVKSMSRSLKLGGLFMTVRDHVIYNKNDKKWFLKAHPLHKFYGGENAFTADEYRNAITKAGLYLMQEIKYYESVINYFPLSKMDVEKMFDLRREEANNALKKRIGKFSYLKTLRWLYYKKNRLSRITVYDERKIPGRMYSYIAIKNK